MHVSGIGSVRRGMTEGERAVLLADVVDRTVRPYHHCPTVSNCLPTHVTSLFLELNSVSALVSNIWCRIPFQQSELSISKIPPTDSLGLKATCLFWKCVQVSFNAFHTLVS
jgi:hypothetical protein